MELRQKEFLKYILLFVFTFLFHQIIKLAPGDDLVFIESMKNYTLHDYVIYRYGVWTGRFIAEANFFIFLNNFFLWKVANTLFLILLSYLTVRILKSKVYFYETLICLFMFGYMSQGVLGSGFFWVTGSMVYLWPLCFGMIAILPYADFVLRNVAKFSKWKIALSAFFGLMAAASNEQVALCLCVFILIAYASSFKKKMYFGSLWIPGLVIFIISAISFMAPGNSARWVAEIGKWYPGYDLLSTKEHIYVGMMWLYQKLFQEMKGLIYILSLIPVIVIFRMSRDYIKPLEKVFVLLFSIVISFNVFRVREDLLYNFDTLKNFHLFSSLIHFWNAPSEFWVALFPYVFWTVYFIILSCLMIKYSTFKKLTLLCILAALCSMVVMFFSPTIFASGNRVLTATAVIFILIAMHIAVKHGLLKNRLLYTIIISVGVLNFLILLATWLIKGFYVIY